jgi:hypothetical protein
MSCDYCGKKVAKGEEFVIVGKYPVLWKTIFSRGTAPEDFGKLYHKACFVESLKREGVKP